MKFLFAFITLLSLAAHAADDGLLHGRLQGRSWLEGHPSTRSLFLSPEKAHYEDNTMVYIVFPQSAENQWDAYEKAHSHLDTAYPRMAGSGTRERLALDSVQISDFDLRDLQLVENPTEKYPWSGMDKEHQQMKVIVYDFVPRQ